MYLDGRADYYEGSVVSVSDYYPFGYQMPSRTVQSNSYRYGFNGKEKDETGEWGSQTHYDYGFRIYNPSIGKFLSVDPLTQSYPYYTPYQFAGNKPIWAIDLDGLEELYYQENIKESTLGKSMIILADEVSTFKKFKKILGSQDKFDVYVYTYESLVGDADGFTYNTFSTDKNGRIEGSSSRGLTNYARTKEEFIELANTRYNIASSLKLDDVKESFENGKGIILLGIATQMLNPLDNLDDDAIKAFKEDQKIAFETPFLQNFINNTLLSATETLIHEAVAHAQEKLEDNSLMDYKKGQVEKEHEAYHGRRTITSPSIEEHDENPKEFKGTKFSKVIKELRKRLTNEEKKNKYQLLLAFYFLGLASCILNNEKPCSPTFFKKALVKSEEEKNKVFSLSPKNIQPDRINKCGYYMEYNFPRGNYISSSDTVVKYKPFISITGDIFLEENIVYCIDSRGEVYKLLEFRNQKGVCDSVTFFQDYIGYSGDKYTNKYDYQLRIDDFFWDSKFVDTIYKIRLKGIGIENRDAVFWRDLVLFASKSDGIIGSYLSFYEPEVSLTEKILFPNGDTFLTREDSTRIEIMASPR